MKVLNADKLKVSKEVLALLRNDQFKPEEKVYEQQEVLFTIPAGDYEIDSRHVPGSGDMKPWTAYVAKYRIGKEEFDSRYRSKVEPDVDADVAICIFAAVRDFTTSSGKLIKKGDTKIFAINAI